MAYAGIDYSLGKSNVDSNGIHFGVISQHSIMPEAMDDFEQDYGKPTCPKCGNEVKEIPSHSEQLEDGAGVAVYQDVPVETETWEQYGHGCADYACTVCEHLIGSEDVFSDEPQGFSYDSDGYKLCDCLDSNIFVLKSPYYTMAQFCSPCVPGAGNLDTPCVEGPKTYCLGHDWFEGSKAPYPVYDVVTNEVIEAS